MHGSSFNTGEKPAPENGRPGKIVYSETAEVYIRDGKSRRIVPITDSGKPTIPQQTKDAWRLELDMLVEESGAASAVIMQIERGRFRIIVSSENPENPHSEGDIVALGSGSYCETVVGTDAPLSVEDANGSEVWQGNAETALGMGSYYGMPVHWSDGSFFGTLCIHGKEKQLDTRVVEASAKTACDDIEKDLETLCQQHAEKLTDDYATAMDAMFRYAPGGIFSYSAEEDEEFSFISINMLALLGYTREEFVEKFDNRFSHMVWHEDRERVLAEIDEQISHGSFDTCEYRIERKDGSIIWVHDEGHIVTDENGKRWFYVVVVDMTNTVDAQRKLAMRNQELESAIKGQQATIDRIPGGIRVFKREGSDIVCVNANQYYADMIGIRKEDLIGETFAQSAARVHPDDRKRHRDETVKDLDLHRYSEGDYRVLNKKTGAYRWYHIEAALVSQLDGSELAYFHYTDVDDLKIAEEELASNKMRYELAVKGARIAVWEYDVASKRMTIPEGVNSEFALARYGLSGNVIENVPECMLPMGATDKDRANFLHLFDEIRAGSEYASTDVWFLRGAEETPICDHISYYVVKDGGGKPVRAYGVGIDVTAQKREQIHFHQAIQSILTANPDSLCTFQVNLTKNLCYEGHGASPFILKTLQSDTASGLFANCLKIIPGEEDRKAFSSVFDRERLIEGYGSGINSQHIDYRRRAESGGLLWVRSFVSLLKNPETNDLEGVIYSLDISREKRRDDIFEILTGEEHDLVALLDLETQAIEAVHLSDSLPKEYRKSFPKPGVTCDFYQMRKNGANDWVAEEDRERYLEGTDPAVIARELDENGSYEMVVKGYLPSRGTVYRKLQHYYLNDEKREVLVIDSDVTQSYLKQQADMEALRAALENAERANEAKSEFLSRMSHDMRTPLNGIIGMTYLAEEMDMSPQARENLKKIDTSSKFLLGLINDILDMTKAESGEIKLHPEPYAPDEFYGYIDAVVRPLCQDKRQTLVLKANTPEGIVPVFDKLRINQVVFNLLSNAVKYTPEGGTITYDVDFGAPGENGKMPVRIMVSDNGIGMSEDFQKILFEPFAQENRVDASETRGTGLGLAIVKRIVGLMGGTISVKSEIGKGSVFTIDMEVDGVTTEEAASKSKDESSAGEDDSFAGEHILLCEDHPLNQEIAKALIEEKGAVVEVADNGQRGVELFAGSPIGFYSAILMDIRMPVMDGYQATKTIRGLDRADSKTVPIIAMTADAFVDDVQKCLDAGMNAHIAKPIEPEILYHTLADQIVKA